jgi:hypothetical protein
MIGEIGALSGALAMITNLFIHYYNASMFDDMLVKTLFKFSNTTPST